MHRHHQGRTVSRLSLQSRDRATRWPEALFRHHAHGKLESPSHYSYDQCESLARFLVFRRSHRRHQRRDPYGDKSLLVHRRSPLSVPVFDRNRLGNQGRQENTHAQKSQLQRHHDGVLELLRRHLQVRSLDPVGHAQLWQGSADANHGHRPRRVALSFPQCAHRRRVLQIMTASRKSNGARSVKPAESHLLPERDLCGVIDTVLRPARSIGGGETEVPVDETISALTRFANNGIHQNVAEHGLTVSVRVVTDHRTARATTNRIDEDSLRAAIEAALSLAHSQPKNPRLLPLPGKQRYRPVNRFVKQTAALTPEDRARAVRRACDLAVKKGQVAAGIFSGAQSQSALGNSNGLFAAYRDTHAVFSITMQEDSAASWAKANAADVRAFDPQKLAERASGKAHQATNPRELEPGRYTVILEPAAVLDLVGFLFYDFSATAVQDKRSCFNDRMGKQLFGKNISITDDVYHPLQL